MKFILLVSTQFVNFAKIQNVYFYVYSHVSFLLFFYRSLSLGIIKLFEKRDGIDWPETGD